jgi:N-acyl-D-amino-acid deacylase
MSGTYDVLIRGATLYDGTGGPARAADLGVTGDRIARIGALAGARAASVIDASGLALAPGFIDVHSHDDFAVLLHPTMECKVLQGVTTDVVGNCGMGAAPFPQASALARALHPDGELSPWEGYAGYMKAVDRAGPSLNVAVLVGHGTLRAAALADPGGAPDAGELARMRALLEEGLAAGAVGFSTGLVYEPGRRARTEELIELARAMAPAGGLYATHMRDEASRLLDSIRETLRIGEEAGVPVQVSHHKASGRANWGLVVESLALLDAARARGFDATADQYPYTAGSTLLQAVVQNDAFTRGQGGGIGDLRAADVVIATSPGHPEWEGRSLEELGKEFATDAVDTARRVLAAEPAAWVILHSMSEDDVRTVMRHPTTMIGSDGLPTSGKPHPRLWGTFPRVLGHYARDLGLLPLEQAIHRMSGLPAAKFRLADRGAIRPGAFADLVLFDAQRIRDQATYTDPCRGPDGIRRVLVNGATVAADGAHTGSRPGRALRRS